MLRFPLVKLTLLNRSLIRLLLQLLLLQPRRRRTEISCNGVGVYKLRSRRDPCALCKMPSFVPSLNLFH